MRDDSSSVRNLIIGMLLVAAPFGAAYLLTRENQNSQIFLVVAIFCVGVALTFAMVSGLQGLGGLALRLSGRSPRDIFVAGLALFSLLTPWTIDLTMGNLHQVFGWTNPLAWVVVTGLLLSLLESARPYSGPVLTAVGLALVAWVGWASWLLTTPAITSLHFSLTPVDIVSTGWFAGLLGFVLAVDAFASRRAKDPPAATAKQVWPLAMVPGMGLVRLGLSGRGRAWLMAAGLVLAFLGITAVNDSEFAYWAHYNTMPPDRGRIDVGIAAATLALVILVSWLDTWRHLRRREALGDWLAVITARSRSEKS